MKKAIKFVPKAARVSEKTTKVTTKFNGWALNEYAAKHARNGGVFNFLVSDFGNVIDVTEYSEWESLDLTESQREKVKCFSSADILGMFADENNGGIAASLIIKGIVVPSRCHYLWRKGGYYQDLYNRIKSEPDAKEPVQQKTIVNVKVTSRKPFKYASNLTPKAVTHASNGGKFILACNMLGFIKDFTDYNGDNSFISQTDVEVKMLSGEDLLEICRGYDSASHRKTLSLILLGLVS